VIGNDDDDDNNIIIIETISVSTHLRMCSTKMTPFSADSFKRFRLSETSSTLSGQEQSVYKDNTRSVNRIRIIPIVVSSDNFIIKYSMDLN
jgi:hypothetical protein